MAEDRISVPYNRNLGKLEALLAGVKQPGDFCVQGAIEAPVPRLEVEGVGVISFPVPEPQVHQLIQQASRAPYGRGEDTIHDESVRKTWQLSADRIRIGGKSWDRTLLSLMGTVADGLGCGEVSVSAELYKLLVYDRGGFFKSHRDTEKVEGMFGTLVIVLPSEHQGGALVMRHAGREVVAELNSAEFSELHFAAFYADCEHEVQPVTEGYRVCLVYNLIQRSGGERRGVLKAPLYGAEIADAGEQLRAAFTGDDSPVKLAWLLEHQYSPAGLGFAGLKGRDAALAKVLCAAADLSGCVVHLGIVHIQEYGPAEVDYPEDYGFRGGRYSYDYEEEEEVSSESYEAVEVSDWSHFIDQWMDTQDQSLAYGAVPLLGGEVLPDGALDGEEPDEQRLTEATGNAGASYERSYHRAALVVWPRDRFSSVLLQAGVAAALPYLARCVTAGDSDAAVVAEQIIEAWGAPCEIYRFHGPTDEPSRAGMLQLLVQLGSARLLNRFIGEVVAADFDGSESEVLARALALLDPKQAGDLLGAVTRSSFPFIPASCVRLAGCLLGELGKPIGAGWRRVLIGGAAVLVEMLDSVGSRAGVPAGDEWSQRRKTKPADAAMVVGMLETLDALDAYDLRVEAAGRFAANVRGFDPGLVLVPALVRLHEGKRGGAGADAAISRLWNHAAEFLLTRSEQPPTPPSDWRQSVNMSCHCEDCSALQRFALDPMARVHRFKVRMDRRHHLHRQIEHLGLDMTHVTERKGSPQTLVCTKTRGTFLSQCDQHAADCASMKALLGVRGAAVDVPVELVERLDAARHRTAQRSSGS